MFKKKRNKNIFIIQIKLQVILDLKVVLKEDNSWSIRGVQPQYMYFLIIMYLEIARENLNICTTFECLCFRKYWNTSKVLYGLSVKMQWKTCVNLGLPLPSAHWMLIINYWLFLPVQQLCAEVVSWMDNRPRTFASLPCCDIEIMLPATRAN